VARQTMEGAGKTLARKGQGQALLGAPTTPVLFDEDDEWPFVGLLQVELA